MGFPFFAFSFFLITIIALDRIDIMIDFRFDWSRQFVLNIDVMDREHKEFFKIGRDVEQLIQNNCIGVTDEELLRLIVNLREYTSYHYYDEDQLMIAYQYPKMEEHRIKHTIITKKISDIDIPSLKRDPMSGLKMILDLLHEIVFFHILTEDKDLAEHILNAVPN